MADKRTRLDTHNNHREKLTAGAACGIRWHAYACIHTRAAANPPGELSEFRPT